MFRFKLIISLHGNEVERMGILKKNTLRYYFYEKLFYSAEYITGCSKYMLDEFQKIFPQIEAGKYLTIHNGFYRYKNHTICSGAFCDVFSKFQEKNQ